MLNKWSNSYIGHIHMTITGTTTSVQNVPKNNSNEDIFHILQTPGLGIDSLSDTV